MIVIGQTVERTEPLSTTNNLGCPVQPKFGEQIVRAGLDAWSRLKQCKTWNDWLVVGEALEFGRVETMRSANTNRPEGRRYNEEFGDWLGRSGFAEIEKSIRSRLSECMARRGEIEMWRATLTTSERLTLNHPAVVLRRWHKTQIKKPNDAIKKPSHVARLNAALIESQEEVERLKRDVERNGSGDRWTPKDSADHVATVIVGTFKDWKAREIARAINRRLKAKKS